MRRYLVLLFVGATTCAIASLSLEKCFGKVPPRPLRERLDEFRVVLKANPALDAFPYPWRLPASTELQAKLAAAVPADPDLRRLFAQALEVPDIALDGSAMSVAREVLQAWAAGRALGKKDVGGLLEKFLVAHPDPAPVFTREKDEARTKPVLAAVDALDAFLAANPGIGAFPYPWSLPAASDFHKKLAPLLPVDLNERLELLRVISKHFLRGEKDLTVDLARDVDVSRSPEVFASALLVELGRRGLTTSKDPEGASRLMLGIKDYVAHAPAPARPVFREVPKETKARIEQLVATKAADAFPVDTQSPEMAELIAILKDRLPKDPEARRANVRAGYGEALAENLNYAGNEETFARRLVDFLSRQSTVGARNGNRRALLVTLDGKSTD